MAKYILWYETKGFKISCLCFIPMFDSYYK